jgi:hypothetical protein
MRIALYLYLIRKVEINELDNSICSNFNVTDMDSFLRNRCNFCINNRINRYFVNYYSNPKSNIPIFDPSFISSIPITSGADVPTDYSNYMSNVSATSVEFLRGNFSTFDEQDLLEFNEYIRDHSNV